MYRYIEIGKKMTYAKREGMEGRKDVHRTKSIEGKRKKR